MQTLRFVAIALALGTTCFTAATGAQAPADSGARVRVIMVPTHQTLVTGRFVSSARGAVTIRTSARDTSLDIGNVMRLEQSIGRTRHTMRGLVTGLAVGVVAGGLIGAAMTTRCDAPCSSLDYSRRDNMVIGATLAAIPLGLIGLAVGHQGTEIWREAYVDRR